MKTLNHLLQANKAWAKTINEDDPLFFDNLSKQQTPEFLWIGCSDSRVPANQIVNLLPGEVFVHRNIANMVIHTDLNCLSVVQYAIEVLKVKHVMVVGHYGCGGVRAAVDGCDHGLIDNWLRHIQDVDRMHNEELGQLTDEETRHNRLCELNVYEQVRNLCSTTIVKDAWARGQELHIHGWIYDLHDGMVRDLNLCVSGQGELPTNTQDIQPRLEEPVGKPNTAAP